ncbi:SDR family NAD(P)-dependent oxidoreductase [Micromonospora sp. NPDC004540]|uniref:SDR family NAD(P)-dependent oxidoreductase n=1 Tax=Micromonospora sp. NPDC004540 TaxID=3154457 RepID=UPI0033B94DAD
MSTPTTGRPLAVVTGASSGIGYELAAQFTEHGYDVVVAAEDSSIATAARTCAHMADTRVGQGKKDDPRKVAEDAFEALMKGEHKVSAGSFVNKLQTAAGKVVPDRLKAEQHRKMAEPGSGG